MATTRKRTTHYVMNPHINANYVRQQNPDDMLLAEFAEHIERWASITRALEEVGVDPAHYTMTVEPPDRVDITAFGSVAKSYLASTRGRVIIE